jgi:hypothetical protein
MVMVDVLETLSVFVRARGWAEKRYTVGGLVELMKWSVAQDVGGRSSFGSRNLRMYLYQNDAELKAPLSSANRMLSHGGIIKCFACTIRDALQHYRHHFAARD